MVLRSCWRTPLCCGSVILMSLAGLANAQTRPQQLRVPLEFTPGPIQASAVDIKIEADAKGQLTAALPGGGELKIERMAGPPAGLIVHVPGGDPPVVALLPAQSSLLWLARTIGQQKSVPYVLRLNRFEKAGQTRESLNWSPAYRAEGMLRSNNCEVGIVVLDLNGDGIFDRKDFRRGTSIGLDLNNDGRVWGGGEWRNGEEIIDVCGSPLEVDDIDPSGRSISFRVSALKPAALNSTVPSFSVTTTGGHLLRSDDFRRKTYLIDFWASWCAPCVAKLDALEAIAREHPNEVAVIGINVDDTDGTPVAERLIGNKALSFPQVIRRQGEQDFLWKMFGSMQGAQLSIPLYVLIDREGVIRYAGRGGEDLVEVREGLRHLSTTSEK
jgi:thiol-disulfide isomerase/thioredoxin